MTAEYHCAACWREYDEESVGCRDEGIGPYDYRGAKSVHHQWVMVCPDCGEHVEDGGLPACACCGEALTQADFQAAPNKAAPCCAACVQWERDNPPNYPFLCGMYEHALKEVVRLARVNPAEAQRMASDVLLWGKTHAREAERELQERMNKAREALV